MRDLNDCYSLFVQSLEKLHDLFALCGMKIPCRLVSKNQFRPLDHRAGYSDQLLLSARELVWEQIFLPDNIETIQSVADQTDALFVRDVPVRQWNLKIFVHGKIVDQVIALKYESDIGLVQLVALLDAEFVELVHWLLEEKIFAGPRPVEHPQDAQQRGFAGTRWTHDGNELARLNIKRDAAKHEIFSASEIVGFF